MEQGAEWARGARLMAVSQEGYWEYRPHADRGWHSPQVLALLGAGAGAARAGCCNLQQAESRVHPDDLHRLQQALQRARPGGPALTVELRARLGAGRWRWLRARVHAGTDALGEPLLYGSLRDIQPEKAAAQGLERAVQARTAELVRALAQAEQRRQAAEAASAAKTHFLAQMSHEIRTPLTGVLGMIELARRAPPTPTLQRYLDTAQESAQALMHVISDLLDLSRIENGQVELSAEAFDPARVMAHAVRAAMPLSTGSELTLAFDWEGDSPCLLGDPGALRQIATNLLTNAVKFTPHGLVALRGRCDPVPDRPDQVSLTLRVSDTGPGIDPAWRSRIFEPFVQGHPHPVRGSAGAGLGLAIARRLVDAMGGSLGLDCPDAGGTEFTLSLTLPRAADPRVHPAPAPVPAGATAWLVYAGQTGGAWMRTRLARLGWYCTLFGSVDEAIEAARCGAGPRPGLVLVGQSALAGLRSIAALHQALDQVPLRLVVRPGWDQPELEAEVHALGLQILVAPMTPAQLARLHTQDLALPDETDDLRVAPPPSPPCQPEVLLVEDDPLNRLVGREFLQALGLVVREAASGAEAVASCLAQPPALVLMDLQMPDMDGFEVSRRLRALQQQGAWPGAPIVALTAHAGTADRLACRAAGMDAMLTKPMSLAKLRRRLARWVPV